MSSAIIDAKKRLYERTATIMEGVELERAMKLAPFFKRMVQVLFFQHSAMCRQKTHNIVNDPQRISSNCSSSFRSYSHTHSLCSLYHTLDPDSFLHGICYWSSIMAAILFTVYYLMHICHTQIMFFCGVFLLANIKTLQEP